MLLTLQFSPRTLRPARWDVELNRPQNFLFQTLSLMSSTKSLALSNIAGKSKQWKRQMQGGKENREGATADIFYFIITNGT